MPRPRTHGRNFGKLSRISSSRGGGRASINIEKADRLKQDRTQHSIGWPHYARNGNCICLCSRCFGSSGCICISGCAGHNHYNCKYAHQEMECDGCNPGQPGTVPSTPAPRPAKAEKKALPESAPEGVPGTTASAIVATFGVREK